jgi:hypothetical protein
MKDKTRQDKNKTQAGGKWKRKMELEVPFETNRGLRSDDLAGDLPEGTSAYEGYLSEVTVLQGSTVHCLSVDANQPLHFHPPS